MSTPSITPAAANPIPDRRRVQTHFADVNTILVDLLRDRTRHDHGQACYLVAMMSLATRWTAPRDLLAYARDLRIDGGEITRDVIEQVREVAVAHAKLNNARAAIDEVEGRKPRTTPQPFPTTTGDDE